MKSKIALKTLLAACLGLYFGGIIPSYCQSSGERRFSDPVFQRTARQRRMNEYARTPGGKMVRQDYSTSDELDYYVDSDGKLYFTNKKGETYPSNGYILPYTDWFFFPRTPGPWNNWGMGKVYVGTVRSGGYAYFDPIKYRQSLTFGSISFSFHPWCRDPWYSVWRYDPWYGPWGPWDPWYSGFDPWYRPWGPYGWGYRPYYPGWGPYYYGYRRWYPYYYPGGYVPGPVIVKPQKQHSRQMDYSGSGSYRRESHTPSSMSGTTSHSHSRTGGSGTSQSQSAPRQYYGGYTPGTYSRSAGIGSGSSSGTRGGSSSGSMSGTSSQSRSSSSYNSSYSRSSSYSGSTYSGGNHSGGGYSGGSSGGYSGGSSGGSSGGYSGGGGGGGHHR